MRALSDRDMLRIWEYGRNLHATERALLLLAPVLPRWSQKDLAALPLGQRNVILLDIREKTAGPELRGFAECPQCTTQLEFSLQTHQLRRDTFKPDMQELYREEIEGRQLVFRLPNTHDLRAVRRCRNTEEGQAVLISRIVQSAQFNGIEVDRTALPESILDQLADRITDLDPQAEVQFSLTCAACRHPWSAMFDMVNFIWPEVVARARHLLDEVTTLAKAFGWSEREILSMTAARRQLYLDMA